MNDFLSINSAKSAMEYHKKQQKEEGYRNLQSAGALANIESRDQLIEQNKLVIKQLAEQIEINQRLEREFEMGARETVIARRKVNWSLAIAIISLIVTIISIIINM